MSDGEAILLHPGREGDLMIFLSEPLTGPAVEVYDTVYFVDPEQQWPASLIRLMPPGLREPVAPGTTVRRWVP